jgi:hypothetical protein
MSKPGLVEQQFVGYLKLVYNGQQEIGESQRNQLRQAFYAGAAMYQGVVLGIMGPEAEVTPQDEAAAQRIFNQYADELEAFAESCVTGMGPCQGSA